MTISTGRRRDKTTSSESSSNKTKAKKAEELADNLPDEDEGSTDTLTDRQSSLPPTDSEESNSSGEDDFARKAAATSNAPSMGRNFIGATDAKPNDSDSVSTFVGRTAIPSIRGGGARSTEAPSKSVAGSVEIDVDQLVTTDTAVIDRLRAFANYVNPDRHIFSFDLLPASAAWGHKIPFDDKSGVLCDPDTNEPYVLWLIGRASNLWFFNSNMEAQNRVNISIVPLTVGTSYHARRLLTQLSNPSIQSVEDDWTDVRAGTFMGSSNTDKAAQPFSESYDARSVYYSAKNLMKPFPVERLKLRDTVMVEVSIGRYKINRKETKEGSGRKYGWVEWRANLELRSISLVHRDPDVTFPPLGGGAEPVHI